jgi:hypothetical protein
MKSTLTLLFVLIAFYISSQVPVSYQFPNTKKIGLSLKDFTPQHWIVRDSVIADFNGDSLNDYAIVVESNQMTTVLSKICDGIDSFTPKLLLVVLGKRNGTFELSARATEIFGDCNWGLQGFDPFQRLEQRRNTLGIKFLTGGTLRDWITYYFRLQNAEWYLIGAERYMYWANHTDEDDAFYHEKINFITREKETYNTNQAGKQTHYQKSSIPASNLFKIADLNFFSEIPWNN